MEFRTKKNIAEEIAEMGLHAETVSVNGQKIGMVAFTSEEDKKTFEKFMTKIIENNPGASVSEVVTSMKNALDEVNIDNIDSVEEEEVCNEDVENEYNQNPQYMWDNEEEEEEYEEEEEVVENDNELRKVLGINIYVK